MAQDERLKPGARIHCMGIGGYGINPLAHVLHDMGYNVSGCDMQPGPLLASLDEKGIEYRIGHSPAHIDDYRPDALVISSAIPADNREVWQASRRGIPVYKRSDILCQLMRDRTGVAIAGTHGKTTTSAMLSSALLGCGADPSFIVGGVLQGVGTNARAGGGDVFVIEADEYDRMFMGLCPQVAVVTTLELDHPDMFADLQELHHLFIEFVGLLPDAGLLIAGYDDPEVRKIAEFRRESRKMPTLTYGLSGGDWTADEIIPSPLGGVDFTAIHDGEQVVEVSLNLPGLHNVQNALAVLAVVDYLGADIEQAAEALGAFGGVGRRFEVKGEEQGVVVIDDYAHHPTAIRATLDAAAMRYVDQPIWAVWQPHTYSRTSALLDEFSAAFMAADHVIVTDVFRSRDTDTYGISERDILDRMSYHRDARHIGALDDVVDYLALNVRPGEVVLVMSAGDATRVGDDLLAALSGEHEQPKGEQ